MNRRNLHGRVDRLEKLEPPDDGPGVWEVLDGNARAEDLRGAHLALWREWEPILFGPEDPREDDDVERMIRDIVAGGKEPPADTPMAD